MEEDKFLGSRLKSLRGKKTQQEVADSLGLSRASYSHYENNRVEPDAAMLSKMADYFDVSIDYLLGREAVKKNKSANIESDLNDEQTNLMFDGWLEMSEEQRQEALDFMEFLKSKNKGK